MNRDGIRGLIVAALSAVLLGGTASGVAALNRGDKHPSAPTVVGVEASGSPSGVAARPRMPSPQALGTCGADLSHTVPDPGLPFRMATSLPPAAPGGEVAAAATLTNSSPAPVSFLGAMYPRVAVTAGGKVVGGANFVRTAAVSVRLEPGASQVFPVWFIAGKCPDSAEASPTAYARSHPLASGQYQVYLTYDLRKDGGVGKFLVEGPFKLTVT